MIYRLLEENVINCWLVNLILKLNQAQKKILNMKAQKNVHNSQCKSNMVF